MCAQTQWQPVGTCRIDNDPQTVVGPELAVNSVENFMVANASVVPAIRAAQTWARSIVVDHVSGQPPCDSGAVTGRCA
ncbi:GMC oxidoreductase [Streptomyces xiangluensis]|uniref:GMC oxidoreductase n=1 Tax=Streptomyces xiangluensis TaxID=2665720 RepID=A0ABV8Z3G6_9ACTN